MLFMKLSAFSFILLTCLFFSCEKRPKRLMVRPLENSVSDSMYSTVFPLDTQPSLEFGRRIFLEKSHQRISDSLLINRIRINARNQKSGK